MELTSEGIITRFDHVVFDYLRAMGRAKSAKDSIAYLNILGSLVALCKSLGGEESRKEFEKLEDAKFEIKKSIMQRADKKIQKEVHAQLRKKYERDKEQALAIVDMDFAEVEEQMVYTTLKKIDIIQVNAPSVLRLSHLSKQLAKHLSVDLAKYGFKFDVAELEGLINENRKQ